MKNYSIIKFGSQLNSNFDIYSDKDLLVVTDSYKQLRKLYNKLTKEGWSVSSYTYSKLEYLSKKGSLFISHLKNDSEIIFDYHHKFEDILRTHLPKNNYENDITESIRYFNIINRIPDLPLGYAWFCDCFYVGLRNYIIFENAKKNIYEFSYLQIIQQLLTENRITNNEYSDLRQLRVVKFNYREDILDELPNKSFVISLIGIGIKLKLLHSTTFIESGFFEPQILKIIKRKDFNGYQRLRLIEGIYCSKDLNIPEIKRIISNPQFYASKLLDDDFLMKIIKELDENAVQQQNSHKIRVSVLLTGTY